ncbi:SDR family oxidoreductase [Brucella sp. 21LCYQ03]|nr:SDR family oxidoreductase [Brucella sp. 21LCYQ03]
MENFVGRNAVVTGGGSGIGRSISRALAGAGANVLVADIDARAAESVAAEVRELGGAGLAQQVDVSNFDDVTKLATHAFGEFGSVDVLVNNAGVTLRPFRASWDTSLEDFRWIMDVNFWGVVHGHMAFVRSMIDRPGVKHIVNTSSVGSIVSVAGHSAYCASKSAVDGFSYSAREELRGFGIGVSLLHPAGVKTDIITSERWRPEIDRSGNRDVVPWSRYVSKVVNPSIDDPANAARQSPVEFATEPWQYIWPEDVGRIVIEGIRANRCNILTHPPLTERIRARAETIIAGAPQPPSV